MCGIFGYIGKKNASNVLIEGLERLEYRGYDSAGVAIANEKGINIVKCAGKVNVLKTRLDSHRIDGNLGIAHTRWATHGLANDINAHPIKSADGYATVVHNGIIENYLNLKEKFDIKTITQCDTEIISELLSKNRSKNNLNTLRKTCKSLKGSYAIAVIFENEQDKIYLAKKESPLMIGEKGTEKIISSDANALSKYSDEFYVLNNGEFVILDKKNIKFYDYSKKISKTVKKFDKNVQIEYKHEYLMQDEIFNTPEALSNTLNNFNENGLDDKFFKKFKYIYLIGCGTAYHSCLIGKSYLEKALNIPVICEIASEFKYKFTVLDNDCLCIFVSQSGETADTIACVKKANEHGAFTLAITNVANSSITFECKKTVQMMAGWERAVASTKAYTCQILTFYILQCLILKIDYKAVLYDFIKKLNDFLFNIDITKEIENCQNNDKIIFIGRGNDYVTSMEASLKLKEITYINCISCPSGELKHGTLALVDNKTLIYIFCTDENMTDKNLSSLNEIRARGGNCVLISQCDNIKKDIVLPKATEDLMPILSILPFQLLACSLSIKLGYNPDKPKNLSKSVTVE